MSKPRRVSSITERKRAEESPSTSEEQLRRAQWAGRIGTFEWNIQTGQSIWTLELEAIYGLPTGGHSGLHSAFENLLHPDDRARMMDLTAWAVRTGEPADAEFRVVWPDGSVHWIAGRAQAFFDESGKPSRLLGLDMDITERKLAEEELTSTNERFNLAIEACSVLRWYYDLNSWRTIRIGKTPTQLCMTPEETSGSLEGFCARVHKDDRERLENALHA